MSSPQRIFSLEEANALLPELERRFSHLLQKKESYLRRHDGLLMHELLAKAEEHGGSDQGAENLEKEIHELETDITELEKDIHDIHEMGCVLRNLNQGFVDFPGKWDGKKVYFCWKKGEKTIQFYHPFQCKTAERRPLAA